MKMKAWIAGGMFSLILMGCGEITRENQEIPAAPQPPPPPAAPEPVVEKKELSNEIQVLPVKGNAAFGSRCADGSITAPQAVPIDFYNKCNANLEQAELVENLQPFTMQVDCKRRLLDIQRRDYSTLTSWEFKSNGEFEVGNLDAGIVKLKDDGAGNKDCSVPMIVYFSGHIDCADPMRPTIYLDTAWFIDRTPVIPPIPAPTPTPSSAPSTAPSTAPSLGPSVTTGPLNPNPSTTSSGPGTTATSGTTRGAGGGTSGTPTTSSGPSGPTSSSSGGSGSSSGSTSSTSTSTTSTTSTTWGSSSGSGGSTSGPTGSNSDGSRPARLNLRNPSHVDEIQNRCKLPPGCYFFNETRIDQCS